MPSEERVISFAEFLRMQSVTATPRVGAEYARAVERAAIPERYRDAIPDDVRAAKIGDGRGIWFCGKVGTGKTHAACAVALAWLKRPLSTAQFVSAAELINTPQSQREPITGQLVLLDDIGKGNHTDMALERLWIALDAIYRDKRTILATSQLMPSELAARLAARGDSETAYAIVSRLAEACHVEVLAGKNWRLGND